jgi:hypothetical protein
MQRAYQAVGSMHPGEIMCEVPAASSTRKKEKQETCQLELNHCSKIKARQAQGEDWYGRGILPAQQDQGR